MRSPRFPVWMEWRESCSVGAACREAAALLGGDEGVMLKSVADRLLAHRAESLQELDERERVAFLAHLDQEVARIQHEGIR